MITFTCECGHSGPYPEDSQVLRCTQCEKRTEIRWFSAPKAYEQFVQWRALRIFAQAKGARA